MNVTKREFRDTPIAISEDTLGRYIMDYLDSDTEHNAVSVFYDGNELVVSLY